MSGQCVTETCYLHFVDRSVSMGTKQKATKEQPYSSNSKVSVACISILHGHLEKVAMRD